jgi:hypothetical protein
MTRAARPQRVQAARKPPSAAATAKTAETARSRQPRGVSHDAPRCATRRFRLTSRKPPVRVRDRPPKKAPLRLGLGLLGAAKELAPCQRFVSTRQRTGRRQRCLSAVHDRLELERKGVRLVDAVDSDRCDAGRRAGKPTVPDEYVVRMGGWPPRPRFSEPSGTGGAASQRRRARSCCRDYTGGRIDAEDWRELRLISGGFWWAPRRALEASWKRQRCVGQRALLPSSTVLRRSFIQADLGVVRAFAVSGGALGAEALGRHVGWLGCWSLPAPAPFGVRRPFPEKPADRCSGGQGAGRRVARCGAPRTLGGGSASALGVVQLGGRRSVARARAVTETPVVHGLA